MANRTVQIVLAVLLLLFLLGGGLIKLSTDWLWFGHVQYSGVFLTALATKLWLGAAGGVTLFFFLLINLLINARHALLDCPKREITISSGYEKSLVFIRVADTGCGISQEDLPKLFLPFYSTKGEHADGGTVQSGVKGSGLGLSLSDTIVRNHGGAIRVESRVGQGSVFTVWLPCRRHGEETAPWGTTQASPVT